MNRLFGKLPLYEYVQVQAYLELLDVQQGVVVEALKQGQDIQANVIPVARNKQFWEHRAVPILRRFVELAIQIAKNPTRQDEFLNSRRPSFIVNRALRLEPPLAMPSNSADLNAEPR